MNGIVVQCLTCGDTGWVGADECTCDARPFHSDLPAGYIPPWPVTEEEKAFAERLRDKARESERNREALSRNMLDGARRAKLRTPCVRCDAMIEPGSQMVLTPDGWAHDWTAGACSNVVPIHRPTPPLPPPPKRSLAERAAEMAERARRPRS